MKSLTLTEADRKMIWVAFANADRKGATIEILGKDLRVHAALSIFEKCDAEQDTEAKDYRLEDADYDHLKTVFASARGWLRTPEAIKPTLAADKAIKAAKTVDAKEKKE